jgi:hypothetical protein
VNPPPKILRTPTHQFSGVSGAGASTLVELSDWASLRVWVSSPEAG